jgi:hypothetical protein
MWRSRWTKLTALIFLLSIGITATDSLAATPFRVSIWQNMSFGGDTGSTSGYSNNTFVAVIGNCLDIKDDICISRVETRKDPDSPWMTLEPKTMSYEEVLCRGCTGQTFGVWKRDQRGLPTGNLPSRWSADGVSIIVQAELYGRYWQGTEVNKPSWNSPETTFLINGIGVKVNSSKLNEMTNRDFRIVIDLKDRKEAVTGFFDGRLKDTDLIVNKDGQFIVQGKPVVVSAASTKQWLNTEIPDDVIEFFKGIYVEGTWIGIPSPSLWRASPPASGFSFGNFMNNDFPKFDFFEKYFDPAQTRDLAAWSISNSNWESFQGVNPCFKGGDTSGVATTNANLYTSGLPTWDKVNQSLDFRMASPHLDSTGKLTSGNYDLILNESVAKCIWGLNEIPSAATLNISYPDGTSEVATVVLSVRNGFVNFHASGFHFSSPTIKIKVTSPPTPASKPQVQESTTATMQQNLPNKVTIKCKKNGKTISKTGIQPVCPIGYKKIS